MGGHVVRPEELAVHQALEAVASGRAPVGRPQSSTRGWSGGGGRPHPVNGSVNELESFEGRSDTRDTRNATDFTLRQANLYRPSDL